MKDAQKIPRRLGLDVRIERTLRHFLIFRKDYAGADLSRFLVDPDAVMQSADSVLLKDGNSQTVVVVKMDGRDIVIKRYNIKGPWHRIRRALRATRARYSWVNAHRLAQLSIRTPEPVAMLESRAGPLRGCSYYLSELCSGRDGRQWFLDPSVDTDLKRVVMKQFTILFSRFEENCIVHGDTKASNFIVQEQTPVTLDLDVMCEYSDQKKFAKAHARDIRRFMDNWKDAPEIDALFREEFSRRWPEIIPL